MATTFNVIYLGRVTDPRQQLDPREGNAVSENASLYEGVEVGSADAPLRNNVQEFSPGSTGFSAGASNDYDTDNRTSKDTFSIDGGPDQVVDGLAVYDATITYDNGGAPANITAVIFQDTEGNTYLAPEMTANSDSTALNAAPIRSIRLNRVVFDDGVLAAERETIEPVCFSAGTPIRTPDGDRPVEDIREGDLVQTADNGVQRVIWTGARPLDSAALDLRPDLRPIRLRAGRFGNDRDILVSPQHLVLLPDGNFARARHLARLPGSGARVARGRSAVVYRHLMCERHEVVFAGGVRTESYYPGPIGLGMLMPGDRARLGRVLPGVELVRMRMLPAEAIFGPRARPVASWRSLRSRGRVTA